MQNFTGLPKEAVDSFRIINYIDISLLNTVRNFATYIVPLSKKGVFSSYLVFQNWTMKYLSKWDREWE